MDALALLCTLHADGPSTLRELRYAGCHDLLDLVASDPQELSECLNLVLPAAKRLQREAQLLGARMQLLEPEEFVVEDESSSEVASVIEMRTVETPVEVAAEVESEVIPPKVVKPLPPSMSSSSANRAWFNATSVPLASTRRPTNEIDLEVNLEDDSDLVVSVAEEEALLAPSVELIDEVVDLTVDVAVVEAVIDTIVEPVVEEADEPEDLPPATISIEVEQAFPADCGANSAVLDSSEHVLAASEYREVQWPTAEKEVEDVDLLQPASPVVESSINLRVGLIDGLDSNLLQLLASANIRSIESLVLASGLDLSRKLSIPFTRLLELQLAAQHLVRNPTPRKAPVSEPKPSTISEPAFERSPAQSRRHTDPATKQASPLPTKIVPPPFDQSLADHSGSAGGPFA